MRKEGKHVSMAKDGTNRGGRRRNTGPKPQAVNEKIQQGKSVKIMNNDIPDLDISELEAVDLPEGVVLEGSVIPKPSDYLSTKQKNGMPLGADAIYKEIWLWLKERHCEKLVNKRLIESYAQAFARYIQCEEAISTYGLLGKHPTTGGVVTSPFVQMSVQFQKQANLLWYEIYDIVKQNCTEVFEDTGNDMMERLLRSRKGI
ncbi:terminase [Streptococcus agalactiae]|nr:terminase [Streptococcus agalactiae]RRA51996.1 terminase [Streptococcus agalactiae]